MLTFSVLFVYLSLLFCSYFVFLCIVVVLFIFIFVCTSAGLLPPGESLITAVAVVVISDGLSLLFDELLET
jgi:hypothetical protein